MTNLMSEIAKDVNKYLYLCNKYNENPRTILMMHGEDYDIYGPHAQNLRKRYIKEKEEANV